MKARLRRPRWLPRPAAVVIAAVVGLGGLGGGAGVLLGELGGAGAGMHQHEDHFRDSPFSRMGHDDTDADGARGSTPPR